MTNDFLSDASGYEEGLLTIVVIFVAIGECMRDEHAPTRSHTDECPVHGALLYSVRSHISVANVVMHT